MKINATLCKPDGLYGMVMPEKPNSNLLKTPGTYGGIQWQSYKDSVKFAKDAAVRYEDQQKVMRLLPTHAVTKIISPREYEMTPGVYPLPEPLDCEQIRLFRYKAIGHSLWLGWVESVTEYDLDVKISQETKPETKLVLRISQGAEGSEPDYSEAHSLSESIRAYGIGVEEKKEPETCIGPWNCKCKVCEAMRVSEREEPTKELLSRKVVSGEAKTPDACECPACKEATLEMNALADAYLTKVGFVDKMHTIRHDYINGLTDAKELTGGSVPTPSDEQIESEAMEQSPKEYMFDQNAAYSKGVHEYFIEGFKLGAKWLRGRLSPEQDHGNASNSKS